MIKTTYALQNLSHINRQQHQSTPFIDTVESEESNEGGLNLGKLLAVIRSEIALV